MSGYCYAVVYDNGRCKFGKTTSIFSRLKKHKYLASSHGVEVKVFSVSPEISDIDCAEKAIIRMANRQFVRIGGDASEMFAGGSYQKYLECFDLAIAKYSEGVCMRFNDIHETSDGKVKLSGNLSPISEVAVNGELDDDCLTILRRISAQKGSGISEGVLRNRSRNMNRDGVTMALEKLEKSNLIVKVRKKPFRGRPSVRYYEA